MTVATDNYVVFRLSGEEYALPVYQVSSIVRYTPATSVPRSAEAVLGVINLRGKVIPVVDVTRRLRGEDFSETPSTRILVAEAQTGTVGLVVDTVAEVTALEVGALAPVPEGVVAAGNRRAFVGVVERNGSLVILLDLDEMLVAESLAGTPHDKEGEAHV